FLTIAMGFATAGVVLILGLSLSVGHIGAGRETGRNRMHAATQVAAATSGLLAIGSVVVLTYTLSVMVVAEQQFVFGPVLSWLVWILGLGIVAGVLLWWSIANWLAC